MRKERIWENDFHVVLVELFMVSTAKGCSHLLHPPIRFSMRNNENVIISDRSKPSMISTPAQRALESYFPLFFILPESIQNTLEIVHCEKSEL